MTLNVVRTCQRQVKSRSEGLEPQVLLLSVVPVLLRLPGKGNALLLMNSTSPHLGCLDDGYHKVALNRPISQFPLWRRTRTPRIQHGGMGKCHLLSSILDISPGSLIVFDPRCPPEVRYVVLLRTHRDLHTTSVHDNRSARSLSGAIREQSSRLKTGAT
jgi:hypothetical protein